MMGDHQTTSLSSTRRNKLRFTTMRLSGCLSTQINHNEQQLLTNPNEENVRTTRSPYQWFKSTASDFPRNLMMKRQRAGRWRSQFSADFSYDASSYALNFEKDRAYDDDRFPFGDFTARLAASPTASDFSWSSFESSSPSSEPSSPTVFSSGSAWINEIWLYLVCVCVFFLNPFSEVLKWKVLFLVARLRVCV